MVARAQDFSKISRDALGFAQKEAERLGQRHIGTEHLFLGLLLQEEGSAAKSLVNLGYVLSELRGQMEELIRQEREPVRFGDVSLTPRAKTVLSLAVEEAYREKRKQVSTAEILIGILLEGGGIAAGFLSNLNVDRIRAEAAKLLLEHREDEKNG